MEVQHKFKSPKKLSRLSPLRARLSPGRIAPGRLSPGRLSPGRLAPGRLSPSKKIKFAHTKPSKLIDRLRSPKKPKMIVEKDEAIEISMDD